MYAYENLFISESIPFVKNQSDTVVDAQALIPEFWYNSVLCSDVRCQRKSTKITRLYCLSTMSRHSCRAKKPPRNILHHDHYVAIVTEHLSLIKWKKSNEYFCKVTTTGLSIARKMIVRWVFETRLYKPLRSSMPNQRSVLTVPQWH